MKFTNPNSKTLKDNATVVGGMAIGAMGSRGVMSLIHKPTGTTDAAAAKKESMMLLAKRGAIIVAGFYGASALSGSDTVTVLVKAALNGMAVMQTIDVVKDLAAKNATLANTSTPVKKFVATSLGLGCACDTPAQAWGMGKTRAKRYLRGVEDFNPGNNMNSLEAMVQNGRQLAI